MMDKTLGEDSYSPGVLKDWKDIIKHQFIFLI